MNDIAIVTDSTSDLSRDYAEKLGITVIPLSVIHNANSYLDGVDITPESFYSLLDDSDVLPTTSQPSIGQFVNIYRRLLESHRYVLSVHISGALSATVDNAAVAAKEFKNRVFVHDSGFASHALAMQVLEAKRLVQEGKPVDRIINALSRLKKVMELLFTVDTLHYLYKGGRIGKASSMLGTLLGIKPVMRVENGGVVPASKPRSIKRAFESIVEIAVSKYGKKQVHVAVGHGCLPDPAVTLRGMVADSLNVYGEIGSFQIGPVIGVHTGPDIIGIAVYPRNY